MSTPDPRAAPSHAHDVQVSLESVLCTEELYRRPRRPPDYETENRVLATLTQELANSPRTILQTLVDMVLQVLKADSAGVSLLTEDGKAFWWPAIAGAWSAHVGGGTLRDFGPCGDVLDRNAPLLFRHPELRYEYLSQATPPAVEALVVPFGVEGKAVGTLWALTHGDGRSFDAEDLRQLESVARFASAAYRVATTRLAALNLLEDANEARRSMEAMNAKLSESEGLLRQAQEAARIGTFNLDLATGVNTWTPELEAMYGLAPGTFPGTQAAFEALIHPDDRADVVSRVEQSIASAAPAEGEWRVIWPDGSVHWLAGRWQAFRDASGTPVRMRGVNIDITERKRADAANALLAAIVQGSDDAIVAKDLAGVITSWNKGAQRMFGYAQEEAIGRPITILIPPERLDEEAHILECIRRGEPVEHFDTVRMRKDGTPIEVSLTISPVHDAGGRVVGASKIARDISERVRLERETSAQAQALADLHRRKDEFLAMLGHELRNPLAPIANAVHMLRLQKDEDPLRQRARAIIHRQVAQLTRLVDDLLEVSRVTTGRIHLRREHIAMNGVVENALETARPLINRRRHALEVSVVPDPVWVHADASRLEQVTVNLIANAAKYTPEGGRISLSLKEEGGEGVLRVRDTGIGIAPDLLPRIFDLFTQAEQSLDRAQGGLGIGLALVQRLVEMHGGRVDAYSAPGQGSEFVVRMPLATAPSQSSQPSQSTAAASSAAVERARVLIVDDNADSAQSVAMLLEATGHEVCVANDGPAALAAALDHRPDVVLLDIGLPGMNGFEVARRLRTHAALGDVILVAMTGYGLESDRQRSREAGFDHHLVKPMDFETLQRVVASVADKRRAARPVDIGDGETKRASSEHRNSS